MDEQKRLSEDQILTALNDIEKDVLSYSNPYQLNDDNKRNLKIVLNTLNYLARQLKNNTTLYCQCYFFQGEDEKNFAPIHLENYNAVLFKDNEENGTVLGKSAKNAIKLSLLEQFINCYTIAKRDGKDCVREYVSRLHGYCIDARTRSAFDYVLKKGNALTFAEMIKKTIEGLKGDEKSLYFYTFVELLKKHWGEPFELVEQDKKNDLFWIAAKKWNNNQDKGVLNSDTFNLIMHYFEDVLAYEPQNDFLTAYQSIKGIEINGEYQPNPFEPLLPVYVRFVVSHNDLFDHLGFTKLISDNKAKQEKVKKSATLAERMLYDNLIQAVIPIMSQTIRENPKKYGLDDPSFKLFIDLLERASPKACFQILSRIPIHERPLDRQKVYFHLFMQKIRFAKNTYPNHYKLLLEMKLCGNMTLSQLAEKCGFHDICQEIHAIIHGVTKQQSEEKLSELLILKLLKEEEEEQKDYLLALAMQQQESQEIKKQKQDDPFLKKHWKSQQIAELTDQQLEILTHPHIQSLIEDRLLMSWQAAQLNDKHFRYLKNPIIYWHFRHGDIDLDGIDTFSDDALQKIIVGEAHYVGFPGGGAWAFPDPADFQAEAHPAEEEKKAARVETHTASVHKSASESIQKLSALYGNQISKFDTFDKIANQIDQWKKNLLSTFEQKAAARALDRFLNKEEGRYTDPVSRVSIKSLIFLIWVAIHDDKYRQGTEDDAIKCLMQALYEIQREYNIDEKGNDQNHHAIDQPACLAGTVNKLVEKMIGIIKDFHLKLITRDMATKHFPYTVKAVLIDHLKEIKNENERQTSFELLLKEGISESLFSKIKSEMINRMFQEFGSVYKNKEDKDFVALIDSAQYIESAFFSKIKLEAIGLAPHVRPSFAFGK